MSVAEFNRSFTVGQAIAFLRQIKGTLQKEAKGLPKGYLYTGLRHAFAEIDGLGKLYCGERGKADTAPNAIVFARKYLGRIDDDYKELFGLLVDMYRHGLAHTHLAKSIKFRDASNHWVTVGWTIIQDDRHKSRHLACEQIEARFFLLSINVPQLVKDTLKAINLYVRDLRRGGERSRLFGRFKRGYIGTAAVFQEPPPPKSSPPGSPAKRRRNPLTLNQYSASGIAWIRRKLASGTALS